jgi:Tfp pilus assembly protein PilF
MPRFADAANNLGTVLGEEGHDAAAETCFRSALSANPRFVRAWVNLAATSASESHFADARSAVESALQIDPQDSDALQLRQMLSSARNDGRATPGSMRQAGSSTSRNPD